MTVLGHLILHKELLLSNQMVYHRVHRITGHYFELRGTYNMKID
jgi:hypothetical protein